MHVFLAGATGAVGRRLVPLLLAAGHRVSALTRDPGRAADLRARGADPVVADVFDAAAVRAALRADPPDAVLHQLTDLSARDLTANSAIRETGTRNLVDAARAAGVRRVVAQSIAWAYVPGDRPATEAEPLDLAAAEPRRGTVDGVATLERIVGEVAEPVVLRYGYFYGPGTWYSPGGAMAERARAGALPAGADVASFVHVDDAAAAALAALDWPPGAVNVCDDEPAPGTAWVPAFCAAVGAPEPSTTDGERAGWARGADNSYATTLGWRPAHSSWRTGFRALGPAG